MPRGGRRPGAGARKGNTNALKSGAKSERARLLMFALDNHPNRVEIVRIGLELGVIPHDIRIRPHATSMADAVRVLYPIIFDPNHPSYHEIAHPNRPEIEAIREAFAMMDP